MVFAVCIGYEKGDKVRAIVTKLDKETQKISLGMKASLFPEGEKPSVEKLSKLAKENAKDDEKGAGSESVFMDSLSEQSKPKTDSAYKNIKKLMEVNKGAKKGQNRMGQRERKK